VIVSSLASNLAIRRDLAPSITTICFVGAQIVAILGARIVAQELQARTVHRKREGRINRAPSMHGAETISLAKSV